MAASRSPDRIQSQARNTRPPSEPESGASEVWIALAGPVASLCLAFAFWLYGQIADGLAAPAPLRMVLDYLGLII